MFENAFNLIKIIKHSGLQRVDLNFLIQPKFLSPLSPNFQLIEQNVRLLN